jgi:hypothetical protein
MERAARWQAAAFSAGAAALHFAEIRPHFEEWAVFGWFFFGVAWFQAAWAAAIIWGERRWVTATGIVVNAMVVGIWLWSRTTGLPIGPEPGVAEVVGPADVLATSLELLIVMWGTSLLAGFAPRTTRLKAAAVGIVLMKWLFVMGATGIVFFLPPQAGSHGH